MPYQERIFDVINDETRYARGKHKRLGPAFLALRPRSFWGVHSSFFYLRVRKWVYQLPMPEGIEPTVRVRVAVFPTGFSRVFRARALFDLTVGGRRSARLLAT